MCLSFSMTNSTTTFLEILIGIKSIYSSYSFHYVQKYNRILKFQVSQFQARDWTGIIRFRCKHLKRSSLLKLNIYWFAPLKEEETKWQMLHREMDLWHLMRLKVVTSHHKAIHWTWFEVPVFKNSKLYLKETNEVWSKTIIFFSDFQH